MGGFREQPPRALLHPDRCRAQAVAGERKEFTRLIGAIQQVLESA